MAPHPVEAAGARGYSVAGFSRLLGGLVPSLSPDAAGSARVNGSTTSKGSGAGGRSGAGRRAAAVPQVSFVGEPAIELLDGIAVMVARFETSSPDGTPVRVFALPKVVIADGFESDPPEGAQQPKVMRWMSPSGIAATTGAVSCEIPANGGTWAVVVSIPPDAMISVALRAESGAQG